MASDTPEGSFSSSTLSEQSPVDSSIRDLTVGLPKPPRLASTTQKSIFIHDSAMRHSTEITHAIVRAASRFPSILAAAITRLVQTHREVRGPDSVIDATASAALWRFLLAAVRLPHLWGVSSAAPTSSQANALETVNCIVYPGFVIMVTDCIARF